MKTILMNAIAICFAMPTIVFLVRLCNRIKRKLYERKMAIYKKRIFDEVHGLKSQIESYFKEKYGVDINEIGSENNQAT